MLPLAGGEVAEREYPEASAASLTSVAEIARSHGFSEPGRFAVAYRVLFGEAPYPDPRPPR
jgi:hypothetical protein